MMAAQGVSLEYISDQPLHEFVMKDWDTVHYETGLIYVEGEDQKEYTFGEIKELVKAFAHGLHQHGVQRGDMVLIFSTNNVEYLVTCLAAWALGATVTTANVMYTSGELSQQIDDGKVMYILTHAHFVSTCEQATEKADYDVKSIIVIGEHESHVTWAGLLNKGKLAAHEALPIMPIDQEEDVALVLYSSGTTGLPKGVMLTHRNVVAAITQIRISRTCSPEVVEMVILPFFLGAGMLLILSYSAFTNPTVLLSRFEPETFFRCIQDCKVEDLLVVPAIAVLMYKSPLTQKYNLSSLKRLMVGAAPLKKETQIGLSSVLKTTLVFQAYGMTEAVAPIAIMPPGVDKPGVVGVPVAGSEIKIIDVETKGIVKAGEAGEICFRGPQVMKGYMNNPEATANTIDKEGWLHTGDVGHFDEEGYLCVVGRIKELIKYKGYQVAPAELEAVLLSHLGVEDAGVVGVLEKEGENELPTAFIARKTGHDVTEEDIHELINGQLAPYKHLRGGVYFIDKVPRTASGKVLRRNLREIVLSKSKQSGCD